MNFWILLQGFGLGVSMIIPIGAQNAFVLNQGIKRNHHLTTATTCTILDMIFISLGIFGGGALLAANQWLLTAISVAGVIFLVTYGTLALKSAFKNYQGAESQQEMLARGRRTVILGAIAATVLNPHLYLDTVVILGSIGGQFHGHDRIAFAIGTILASFVWFFTISIGAAKLSPVLSRPKVRQGIDIVVALMMYTIAALLLNELLG